MVNLRDMVYLLGLMSGPSHRLEETKKAFSLVRGGHKITHISWGEHDRSYAVVLFASEDGTPHVGHVLLHADDLQKVQEAQLEQQQGVCREE